MGTWDATSFLQIFKDLDEVVRLTVGRRAIECVSVLLLNTSLTNSGGNRSLLPNLRDLYFLELDDSIPERMYSCYELAEAFTNGPLRDLLVSRREAGIPLQSVHLYFPTGNSPESQDDNAGQMLPTDVLNVAVRLVV